MQQFTLFMLGDTVVVNYKTVEGEGAPSGSGSEVQECPLDIAPRDQAEVVSPPPRQRRRTQNKKLSYIPLHGGLQGIP